jgi:hypothetical protein
VFGTYCRGLSLVGLDVYAFSSDESYSSYLRSYFVLCLILDAWCKRLQLAFVAQRNPRHNIVGFTRLPGNVMIQ